MGKFVYKRRSFEESNRRAEQSGFSKESFLKDVVKTFKPPEGTSTIRILPPSWEDAAHYGLDIYVHYSIGADKNSYLCPQKMLGERCPICEERDLAEKDGDKEYLRQLRCVKRVLVYLIDMDKQNEGVKIWAMPWTLDKDIMIQAVDQRTKEVTYIDDPDEGYNINITKAGSKDRTEYTPAIARKPSVLKITEDIANILEENPLTKMLVYYDYDHIKRVFDNSPQVSETQETQKPKDADEVQPRRTATRAKRKEIDVDSLTYDKVQALSEDDVQALIQQCELDINVDDYESDKAVRDEICSMLDIPKPRKAAETRVAAKQKEEEEEDSPFEEPLEDPPAEESEKKASSSTKDRLASFSERFRNNR